MGNNQPKPDAAEFAARLNEILDQVPGAPKVLQGRGAWLAKRFKVSKPTAQGWIKGDYLPVPERVMTLAQMAGVRFEWLYYGSGPRSLHVVAEPSGPAYGQAAGAFQPVRKDDFKLAFRLAVEALGDAREHVSPEQFSELGNLIYDLLVADGMPEAQVLQFARRTATAFMGDKQDGRSGEDQQDS